MKTNSQTGVVRRMREIRDEFSLKIMNMTFEEEKAYFREIIAKSNTKFKPENMNK